MRITTLVTPLGVDPYGEPVLVFRELCGKEALNTLFDYKLLMHSTKQAIDPAKLIGQTITVSIKDQNDNDVYLNALVSEFTRVGRDEQLTLYQATLSPWLALATLSQDCRIFENISAPDLVTQVLAGYGYPIERSLVRDYPTLFHVVQYNETDYAFICRLLEDAGIGYHFEHQNGQHTLVLSDAKSSYRSIPGYDSISFNSPQLFKADANGETIEHWYPSQRIKPGSWSTSAYDYRQPYANLAAQGIGAAKDHAHDNGAVYHFGGQQRYNDYRFGQQLAQVEQDQQEQHYQTIEGDAKVRAILMGGSGSAFQFTNHPVDAENQEVLIYASTMSLKENPSHTSGANHTEWDVSFTVIPSKHQYRPQRVTPMVRISGPQTAVVVGPAGQEIWTNDLSEVKIQTWWDRTMPEGGWRQWVRVGTGWAGNTHGEIMIPRVGDEVIVQFLDGNPAAPIITAKVANSRRTPHAFSSTGNLPGNQALAGVRSKELGGSRHNQLLFDDTSGQIRTQLESDHGSTQLNLGYLVYPRDTTAGPRGEGFELRTDAWGAIRADKGLLLSTDNQPQAQGNAMSREELIQRLEEALALAKSLGDFAAKNQGNASDPKPQDALNTAVKNLAHGSNAEKGDTGEPAIAISAPAGIVAATPKSATIATGLHIDLVAQQNQHITAGQKMNLHAGQGISQFAQNGGIKSIANHGKHITQSQDDEVHIIGDKSIQITSSTDGISVLADKYVLISAGGAYIRVGDGNIQLHCPGTLDKKAGNYSLTGPTSLNEQLPQFGKGDTGKKFVLRYGQTQTPAPGCKYRIKLDDGDTIEGVTDAQGQTSLAAKDQMRIAAVEFLKDH